MTDRQPSVAVIGAGIIGSWTALHLAEAGARTTLFEQFPLPHTRGSSHGMSRVFRYLGELELDRLDYSQDRWRQLEAESATSLFVQTGLLNFGPQGDPDLEQYMDVLREAGRPYEWLDSRTLRARFPMLKYPEDQGAAWDPNGGILFAHRCLNAVQSRFLALGGQLDTGRVSVDTAKPAGHVVEVRSSDTGEIRSRPFDRLVICAGPWTSSLMTQLDAPLHDLLRSVLTPVTYWHDPSGRCSVANGFPILFNARLTGVYGLPSCEYPGLVKILYHGGPDAEPDTRDHASVAPFVEKVRRYVAEHLPLLDHGRPAIMESCMYTMTPDGLPVIDRLAPGLVVGCGFSGSGFKHSPATGLMLAHLALELESHTPAGFRSDRYLLSRFGAARSAVRDADRAAGGRGLDVVTRT